MGRQLVWLPFLPPRVAAFYLRALARALLEADEWTATAATRPRELSYLLRAARGRRNVVEIGTAGAWTSAALSLADRSRIVTTIDPVPAERRDRYLDLLGPDSRRRIQFVIARGEQGPSVAPGEAIGDVEFLFIDGDHSCEGTLAAFEAWRPALAPDALVAVHDYADPAWPGVTEAVRRLGLNGSARGTMLIAPVAHRTPR